MIDVSSTSQASYFDEVTHQYPEHSILHPPYHTSLEIMSILTRIPPIPPHEPVIDFGSGSGRLTLPLLQAGYRVLAIDVSHVSSQKLIKLAGKFSTRLATADQIPLHHKSPLIIGTDILHHVDFNHFFSIFYSSLKIDGKIIFSEPGAHNPFWYLYLPFRHDWAIEKGLTQMSLSRLSLALVKAGFVNIHIIGVGLLPRFLFNRFKFLCRLNDRLGNLPILKFFAYRYLLEAQKI